MSTQGEISDTFYSSNLLQTAVNLVGEAVENCEKAKVSRNVIQSLRKNCEELVTELNNTGLGQGSEIVETFIDSLRSLNDMAHSNSGATQETPSVQATQEMNTYVERLAEHVLALKDRLPNTVQQVSISTKAGNLVQDTTITSKGDGVQVSTQIKRDIPKYPVVLCHGLCGFDSVDVGLASIQYWQGVERLLEKHGVEVLVTKVPATSSPIDRAMALASEISRVYAGRSIHLIGHSMGGLDCRYLASNIKSRNFQILSVTTIATPHRGSPVADSLDLILNTKLFPAIVSGLDKVVEGVGSGEGFGSLTAENMRKFNEVTPDVPGVKYFSWGAVFVPGILDLSLAPSHLKIVLKEGPNDGLVSEHSAKWGTYLGTLKGVNHWNVIGWIVPLRYTLAELGGRTIDFRPETFYLKVMEHLARSEVDQTTVVVEQSEVVGPQVVQQGQNDRGGTLLSRLNLGIF